MISARIPRNVDGNAGALQSKTPAGKASSRRVAFGDISNRKPNGNQTPAVKKSVALPKTLPRVVDFDIPCDEPKEILKANKPVAKIKDDAFDDDDDILGVEVSPFSLSGSPKSEALLDKDDWKAILDEENEQLEWERDLDERRRALEEREDAECIAHLERSIAAMHEQDAYEVNMAAEKFMNESFERSIDFGEEEVISFDIGF